MEPSSRSRGRLGARVDALEVGRGAFEGDVNENIVGFRTGLKGASHVIQEQLWKLKDTLKRLDALEASRNVEEAAYQANYKYANQWHASTTEHLKRIDAALGLSGLVMGPDEPAVYAEGEAEDPGIVFREFGAGHIVAEPPVVTLKNDSKDKAIAVPITPEGGSVRLDWLVTSNDLARVTGILAVDRAHMEAALKAMESRLRVYVGNNIEIAKGVTVETVEFNALTVDNHLSKILEETESRLMKRVGKQTTALASAISDVGMSTVEGVTEALKAHTERVMLRMANDHQWSVDRAHVLQTRIDAWGAVLEYHAADFADLTEDECESTGPEPGTGSES